MRVTLIGTGGTIASRHVDGAVVATVPVADLLAAADLDVAGEVDLATVDLGTSPSFALSLEEVSRIALRACAALEDGAEAVGLTHGTDSMEETVFLLDLLHAGEQPVAVTGAQRPHDDPRPDGPGNLTDLLRVLTSPEARGHGALLVFAGHAWPAVGVRKVHTSELNAFAAESGPRLQVDATAASGVRTVTTVPGVRGTVPGALGAVREHGLPAVDVVAAVPGGDGSVLAATVERGSRGVILQALGIGNVGPADTEQVRRAVDAGVPVMVTSRVPHGRVQPVYGGGGGFDLERAGAVFAGSQTTWQARVLLSVALALEPNDPLGVVRPWLERHESSH